MNFPYLLRNVLLFVLTVSPLRAGDEKPAEEKPADKPAKPAEKPKEEKIDPAKLPLSVTRHEITVGDHALKYVATAGSMTLSKPDGDARAGVFYVAYTLGEIKKDAAGIAAGQARPVTFCFNGGPGSSAVWLHLGAFGPRRVLLPEGGTGTPKAPFQLVDNPYTLLETTDLVFVDPVSTGYSRPEKGQDPKQFHGFNEDVESVGDFIRLYVSKNQRWNSPKFLMGESYGGIRSAGLAGHLQSRYGMSLNGVIIVSGVLDFQTLNGSGENDLAFICFLPTMSNVARYHKKLAPELLQDPVKTALMAREFAQGVYASALLKGASLPAAEKHAIAAQISEFTSLPEDLILRENLRVSPGLFFGKLLEKERQLVGRFDGRVVGDPEVGDPSYNNVYGAFASSLNAYIRGELRVKNDQPYEILSSQVHPWNYDSFTNRYVNVAGTLSDAIQSNPSLRVYVACGHYDLATPADGIKYSFDHMPLNDKQRQNVQFSYYEGGHMMYTNLPELEKLSRELAAFVKAAQ